MANAFYTLADLLKINDRSTIDAGLSDLFNASPALKVLPALPATHGTVHQYVKQVTAPTVGFRAANVGRANSASGDTLVTATLQILDGSFHVDKAVADGYVKGADAFVSREGQRSLQQLLFNLERQVFCGTLAQSGGDSAGFTGLPNSTALDGLSDVAGVVDAGGTTANTASSVWLVRAGGDEKDVNVVLGNGGELKVSEAVVSSVGDTNTVMPSYFTAITGYAGVQIGGLNSVKRICNLTADSGKGLTDALIYKALALFPSGQGPTHMFMNRRSLYQLRASRTATNATGAAAPVPVEVEGIQIVATDAVSITEALIA